MFHQMLFIKHIVVLIWTCCPTAQCFAVSLVRALASDRIHGCIAPEMKTGRTIIEGSEVSMKHLAGGSPILFD